MNLDKQRVGHQFNKSAYIYDDHSAMQREIVDSLIGKADVSGLLSRAMSPSIESINVPTVCDLGCGTGYALSAIANNVVPCNLLGIDLAPAMLRVASDRLVDVKKQYLNLLEGDIESVPLRGTSIDLCISSSALQWCDNEAAFAEIYRILKPGAYALLSSFALGTLAEWRALWGGINDQRFLSLSDFESVARMSGLVVDELSSEQKIQPFPSFESALSSVRDLGAGNAGRSRGRGLMGASRLKGIVAQVNNIISQKGRIDLVYEVVYLVVHKPANCKV